MKKLLIIFLLIVFITLFIVSPISSQSSPHYFWIKDYYSDSNWDNLTDFVIDNNTIVGIGKIGSPFESQLPMSAGRSLAIMVFNNLGEMEKLRIIFPPSTNETSLFGYRIFKENEGYLIFAANNPTVFRERFGTGDNGFNYLYVMKINKQLNIEWIKSYYRPAVDIRDIVFSNGFYYVLLFDLTRNYSGTVGILKINKDGEIVSTNSLFASDYWLRLFLVESSLGKIFLVGLVNYRIGMSPYNDELLIAEIDPQTLNLKWKKTYGKMISSVGKGVVVNNGLYIPVSIDKKTSSYWEVNLEIWQFNFNGELLERKRILQEKNVFFALEALYSFNGDSSLYLTCSIDESNNIIKIENDKISGYYVGRHDPFGWLIKLEKDSFGNFVFGYPILFPSHHNHPLLNVAVNDFVLGYLNQNLEIPYGENEWYYKMDIPEKAEIIEEKISETETAKKVKEKDLTFSSAPLPTYTIYDLDGRAVKIETLTESKVVIHLNWTRGGKIEPIKVIFRYGDTITYRFIPDEGYRIKDVLIDGVSVGPVTSYTFENITEEHTVRAIFEPITFTITASAGIGGTIIPSGKVIVNYKESKTFVITPEKGFKIKDVLVDGKSVGPVTSYTFENVLGDHTIEAIFEPLTFTITASAGIGGTISPSGKVEVKYGESKRFTITPDKGYKIKDVLVDGKSVGAVSVYTFENIDSDHSIEVIFETQTFTINSSSSVGGTIEPFGKTIVKYGESKTFKIIPDKGYKIKDVIVDGKSVGAVSVYTFSNIDSDHKIEVIFEKEKIVIILQIGNKLMYVNYREQEIDVPPQIIEGRTLLPIKYIVEPLGGEIAWDSVERKVTILFKDKLIELWIGKNIAKVNGVNTPIDPNNPKVVPMIILGRTMLPVRFVAENLGCKVDWDGATKTVTITYPGELREK